MGLKNVLVIPVEPRGGKGIMKRQKYEKPMLVELGFDSNVFGVLCQNGPDNAPVCNPTGSTAKNKCTAGASVSLPNVCIAGPTPAS